jgi:hypothetical protein
MLTVGDPPESAAVVDEKYPSNTTLARPEAITQVVVIATGALPVAVPPATSVKLTVEGVAATVNDSDKTAFKVTDTVLEFSWAWATGAASSSPHPTHSMHWFRKFGIDLLGQLAEAAAIYPSSAGFARA